MLAKTIRYPSHTIGHFRVPLCLCFKASLSAKPFLRKWAWFAWKWNYMQNSFSYERFALRLVLNLRHKRTRKWPILFLHKPSHTPRILSFGSLTRTASHVQNWWVFYFVNMTDSWLTMAACIRIWSEGNHCNNTSRTFFSWFRSKLVGFWPGYYFVACERRRISGCHWFGRFLFAYVIVAKY